MKENEIVVDATPEAEAKRLTAENKHGYVWPAGLYVVVDNSRCVLETREEVNELIAELNRAADEMWPRPIG